MSSWCGKRCQQRFQPRPQLAVRKLGLCVVMSGVGLVLLFVVVFGLTVAVTLLTGASTYGEVVRNFELAGIRLTRGSWPAGVPFYVVEEHHEALPYWLDYAGKDSLLIHVDAHPDLAIPRFADDEAHIHHHSGSDDFYKSAPRTQVRIEQNDEFIHQAARLGVVSTVLWVWPTWDRGPGSRHGKDDTQQSPRVSHARMGTLRQNPALTCVCETDSRPVDILRVGIPSRPSGQPGSDGGLRFDECMDADDEIIPQVLYFPD